MTDAERARLRKKVVAYALKLRDEMWVGRWELTIRIVDHPGDDDTADAMVLPTEGRHCAVLEVSWDAAYEGGERLRHTLTHEFIHLYHRNQTDLVRLALPRELGQSAYNVFYEGFRQATEVMVDDLAFLFAKWLPLPEWNNEP